MTPSADSTSSPRQQPSPGSFYDGDRLIAEYDGSGALKRRYVHGAGVDEPLLWYEGDVVSAAKR